MINGFLEDGRMRRHRLKNRHIGIGVQQIALGVSDHWRCLLDSVMCRLASADFYRNLAGQEVLHEAEFLLVQLFKLLCFDADSIG